MRRPAWTLRAAVLFASLGLTGCATGPKVLVREVPFPVRVAVLPFLNETNDVGAPETVRKAWSEGLPLRGYSVVAQERVDEVLKEKFGITEGGQLGSATPQQLGEVLEVEGLFYGNVLTFVDLPLGFSRKRAVKAEFWLVLPSDGRELWRDRKLWAKPELTLDPKEARAAAVRQVAERQLEKMTGRFLREESRIVAGLALQNLPPAGRAADSLQGAEPVRMEPVPRSQPIEIKRSQRRSNTP